jgi:hypothetical protein
MEERYAVVLNGKKIGTIHLDPTLRGTVRARLAPLPAFRSVARHRRILATAREWDTREEDLAPAELAAVDGAEAVLDSLKLTLETDGDGTPVRTRQIALLRGEPPHLRVIW